MRKNKRDKKIEKDSFVLINRYNPKDFVSITKNYQPIIEKQLNYVDELPPFVYNRMNKRGRSSKALSNRIVKHENVFNDYKDFAIKPSILYSSKMKLSDIFSKKMTKYRTYFPLHYNQNLIPCHVYHKTSSFKLIWDKPFKEIDYSKVLTACFEGIIETAHPYKFISRQACKELLMAENSHIKILPILSELYDYIRIALLDENDETFLDTCDICLLLVIYGGEEGYPYMKLLFSPFQKRIFGTQFTDKIYAILNMLCKLFGENAFYTIKKIIPSFFPDTTIYG
jgi:hypothetical protein